MEKIEEIVPYEKKMDSLFKELYEAIDKSDFIKRIDLPKYRGVYVFYDKGKPIYVGRANNIRNRIQWHTRASSGSESASFAFNLAKKDYSSKIEIKKTRKELMQIEEFIEIFKSHKLNLSTVEFKCIEIKNDILQTMFEPYLAFKLRTYPINNTFENH
nr:GIY-YIG nuclease family protein [uncultured Flavobacterium sp.]